SVRIKAHLRSPSCFPLGNKIIDMQIRGMDGLFGLEFSEKTLPGLVIWRDAILGPVGVSEWRNPELFSGVPLC
ncbi:MAG: hypothetical protein QNJ97_28755, partial [Myxococcota bacterium]|nr:hypothetical protein [Myxococcota bacterium]